MQAVLENYNSRMSDADYVKNILDDVSAQLMELLRKLKEEENSFNAMGIDYEEKAFYDILTAVAEKFQFEFPEKENIGLEDAAAELERMEAVENARKEQDKLLGKAEKIIPVTQRMFRVV